MENALTLLLLGVLISLSLLLHWGLRWTVFPAIAAYLLLGFLLRMVDSVTGVLTESAEGHLSFLAEIGVVILLFRVGIESNIEGLMQQFRRAQLVWLGNVLVSGGVGYVASFYVLGFPLVPSLYIATALTATSVAVSVGLWREARAVDSSLGQLLLDTAEMDDVSAIVLMSLLFAVTPVLIAGSGDSLFPALLSTGVILFGKLLLFGGFCYLFSRFAEQRLTHFYRRIKPMPDPMLMLVATGFIIAALAGLLGFSIALGAFFAGLVFSRDPEAVTLTRPFAVLYDLFTPFFFISLGLHVDPQIVTSAMLPGVVLLLAAVLGKVIGTVGAAYGSIGWKHSCLLGISMIPRAEIALIVMQHGLAQGESVVPPHAFAAMVFVSAATCILTPLVLQPLLMRQKL